MDWITGLRLLGFLTIIGGIAAGFVASSAEAELSRLLGVRHSGVSTWVSWAIGGAISSVVWFALATIIENQHRLEQRMTELLTPPKEPRRISTGDYPNQKSQRPASGSISWPDR